MDVLECEPPSDFQCKKKEKLSFRSQSLSHIIFGTHSAKPGSGYAMIENTLGWMRVKCNAKTKTYAARAEDMIEIKQE